MNYSSKCIVIVLSLQSMLCSWAHAQKEERIIPIDQLMNSRNMTLKEIDSAANIYFRRSGTGKGSGYKQFQRWRYESQFHVNGEGYLISRLQEEQYLTADNGLYESLMDDNCMTEPGERWVEKGPFTLQTNAGATSPGIGALTAIAINTSQPFTIYVGSPEGGIWKSTDWGAHWQPKISCPNSYMSIFSIAIDPHNSNRIYAGTGNNGAGFLTSDDGGEHWVHCTHSTVPGGFVRKIWINPQYSNVIYTASSYGLLKSVDSGKHWNTLLAINMDDFEFKPGDTNTIYACGYSGIYRSLNGGQNWDTLGVSNGIFGLGKNRLAVTPADPNKVYLLRSDTNHKMFSMLMVSNNSGSFFVPIIGPSYPLKFFSANDTDTTGQAFHNMELEVSATNADDILIGGVDLFRSLDGGFSFNRITRWFLPQATPTMPYVHGDFQGILFRNGFWYVINDGGIYVSVNQGLAWTDLSNGLRIREFYRIGSSSIDSLQFVAGAQDNGTTATLSYLANQLTDWRGGDGMECIISPLNMQKMYGCAFSGNLFRTDDGGLTNIGLAKIPDGNWVTPYVLRPGSDNTIIAGGDEVYKSDNSGGFFYPITFNLTNNRIVDLAVAPSNSNYIYACDDNKLYVSKSNGFLWDTIAHIAQIKDIAVSPSNPDRIWFAANNTSGYSSSIYRYEGSGSPQNLATGIPATRVRTLVVDDTPDERLFAGFNQGVYTWSNIDPNWTSITQNLPKVGVNELDLQLPSYKLRAATYGRGIWETSVRPYPEITITRFNIPSNNCLDSVFYFAAQVKNGGTNPVLEWHLNTITIGNNNDTLILHDLQPDDSVYCIEISSLPGYVGMTDTSNKIKIQDYQPPVLNLQASQNTICKGEAVQLNASLVSSSILIVQNWQPVGGFLGSNQWSIVVTPLQTTTYTFSATDNHTCTTSIHQTIVVNDLPELPSLNSPVVSPSSVCLGDSVHFMAPLNPPQCSVQNDFKGAFGPYSVLYGNPGVRYDGDVDISGIPNTVVLKQQSNWAGYLNPQPEYRFWLTCEGILQFHWTYHSTDSPPYSYPMYDMGNGSWQILPGFNPAMTGAQSGIFSDSVYPGAFFRISNVDYSGFGNSDLTIFNLSGPYLNYFPVDWYSDSIAGTLLTSMYYSSLNSFMPFTSYLPEAVGQHLYYAQITDPYTGCRSLRKASNPVQINPVPVISTYSNPPFICPADSAQLHAESYTVDRDSIVHIVPPSPYNSDAGIVFKVKALKPLSIKALELGLQTASQLQVWYKPGGYGDTAVQSSSGWTMLGTTMTISPIPGQQTRIELPDSLTIAAGQVMGILLVSNGTVDNAFATSPGQLLTSDNNIEVYEGFRGWGMNGNFHFTQAAQWIGKLIIDVHNEVNTISWQPNAGLSTNNLPVINASPSLSTTYTVTATSTASCSSSAMQNVYVNPLPVQGIAIATPNWLCTDDTLQLQYQPPTGLQCNGVYQTGFYTSFQEGNWIFTQTNASATGDINTIGTQLSIQSPAVYGMGYFLMADYSVIVPCNGIISFQWHYYTFGNASWEWPEYAIDNGVYQKFQGYKANGTFEQFGITNMYVQSGQILHLRLRTVDSNKADTYLEITSFKAPIPTPSFQSVQWYSSSIGGTLLGSGNNMVVPVYDTGVLHSFAQLTSLYSGCTDPVRLATNAFTVTPSPVYTISLSADTLCYGDSAHLIIATPHTVLLQPGNHSAHDLWLSPTSTTTYTLTLATAQGCYHDTAFTITVYALPVVNLTLSTNVACAGDTVHFEAVGASQYLWQPGSYTGAVMNIPVQSFTTYELFASDTLTGCSVHLFPLLLVNPVPFIYIQPAGSVSICNGNSVTLSASGGISYLWQPGASSVNSFTVSPVISTTYTLTGTDGNGCTASAIKAVNVQSCSNSSLELHCYIEGFYNSAGEMLPVLLIQGVPGAQIDLCDTVEIRLHESSFPYLMVASQKALLFTDGSVNTYFNLSGSYFIEIRHRNAIATWSATPVLLGASPLVYNFSTSASMAFGANQTEVDAGLFAFYSGDVNNDENIDLLDYPFMENDISHFESGYFATDLNGDGNVDILDFPLLENNALNFIFSDHP